MSSRIVSPCTAARHNSLITDSSIILWLALWLALGGARAIIRAGLLDDRARRGAPRLPGRARGRVVLERGERLGLALGGGEAEMAVELLECIEHRLHHCAHVTVNVLKVALDVSRRRPFRLEERIREPIVHRNDSE
jgi:hypothetical protein